MRAETQNTASGQLMFTLDAELARGLAMAGMSTDWMQWNYVIQRFIGEDEVHKKVVGAS